MTLRDLKIVEDFLKLPPVKRYKGPSYGKRKMALYIVEVVTVMKKT